MICEKDLSKLIRTCRPYVNRNQLYVFLRNLCDQLNDDDCVVVLPAGTPSEDFIEDGFSGSIPNGCEQLTVIYDDGSQIWQTSTENINWCNILQLPKQQVAFKVNRATDQSVVISGIFDFVNTEFDTGNQVDLVNNYVSFPDHYDGFWKIGANLVLNNNTSERITVTIRSTAGSPNPSKVYLKEDVLAFAGVDNSFSISGVCLIEEDQDLEVLIEGVAGTINVNSHTNTTHNTFWGYKLRGNFSEL